MQVVEFATRVCHACRFDDAARLVQGPIPSKGIGLQNAGKAAQMLLRMLALAIRRVSEPDRRGCRFARRAVIPDIDPEPAGLGTAPA